MKKAFICEFILTLLKLTAFILIIKRLGAYVLEGFNIGPLALILSIIGLIIFIIIAIVILHESFLSLFCACAILITSMINNALYYTWDYTYCVYLPSLINISTLVILVTFITIALIITYYKTKHERKND